METEQSRIALTGLASAERHGRITTDSKFPSQAACIARPRLYVVGEPSVALGGPSTGPLDRPLDLLREVPLVDMALVSNVVLVRISAGDHICRCLAALKTMLLACPCSGRWQRSLSVEKAKARV